MQTDFHHLLQQLRDRARACGLSEREWAAAAGLRPETLCRLGARTDCDFQTLSALAAAVGLSIGLQSAREARVPERHGRAEEERLARLCASGSLDVRAWLDAGPRWFMAGLALLLAGRRGADREGLATLAAALEPAMLRVEEYQKWLDTSPVKPSRFLPLVDHWRARLASVEVAS